MKGDLFEIFAECFFKVSGTDNRIGMNGYKNVPVNMDFGVDAFGKGIDGKPAIVQVKFREDKCSSLVSDDLKQFVAHSYLKYDVTTSKSFIVFTSAKSLHWNTESNVFQGKVRCIGYNETGQMP